MCLQLILFLCGLAALANAKSPYVFSMDDSPLHTIRSAGNITAITAKEFPILKGLSIRRLILLTSAVREPHWHANANELTYCLRGSALVTIFGNEGEHHTFTVSEGQMFFVPSGYLHHIENLSPENETSSAEFIIAFSHELPEDFGLSSAFGAMTNAVLGNTFQLPADVWKDVVKRDEETSIGKMAATTNIDDYPMYQYPNKYKFDVERMSPPLAVPEGSAKMASKKYWPILENISMFSLRISTEGMREPHWHPKTAEMGYLVHGHARMTILSPNVDNHRLDTYQLNPGDVYFVPRAYPHHIENIGDDEVLILVFFDQPISGDIGYTGSWSSYSKTVLAATFRCSPNQLPDVPFNPKDLLIVHRINPVEHKNSSAFSD